MRRPLGAEDHEVGCRLGPTIDAAASRVDSCKVALTKVQEALESKVGVAEGFRGRKGGKEVEGGLMTVV